MSKIIEIETKPAEITWLGKLGGERPNPAIWEGSIPAKNYRLTPERLAEYKELVGKYYVKVDPGSPVRCIDGRPAEGILDDKGKANTTITDAVYGHKIGPQVPGGSPAGALSYRTAIFNYDPGKRPEDVLLDDLFELYRISRAAGIDFKIGAHEDDHAEYPNTGCKAIDDCPIIMEKMPDPEALPEIMDLTKAIMGESYDENIFMEVIAIMHYMNRPEYKKTYLQQDEELGTDYKDIVLAMVRKEADEVGAVEKMVGPHKEFAAISNKRRAETFDRNCMSLEHNNEIQIFNFDYWAIDDAAALLFPNNQRAQKLYLTSRTMYFIATAMVITNGNLEVGIRD